MQDARHGCAARQGRQSTLLQLKRFVITIAAEEGSGYQNAPNESGS